MFLTKFQGVGIGSTGILYHSFLINAVDFLKIFVRSRTYSTVDFIRFKMLAKYRSSMEMYSTYIGSGST